MCGRFAMKESEKKIMSEFQIQHSEVLLEPRYNICPSQDIPVIIQQDGLLRLEAQKWGLIPFWAKIPKPMINARAETAKEKPTFKQAFRKRRCLIPSSGFFEWTKEEGKKQPYFFCLKNNGLMAFAGIWEKWSDPDGKIVKSCAILTIEANSYLKSFHHRMPIILTPSNGMNWLNLSATEASLKNLFMPFNSENMRAWKVTRKVNSPDFDNPNCLEKLDDYEQ